jgi:hypothetical protein
MTTEKDAETHDSGTEPGAAIRYFGARPKLLQKLQQRTVEMMGVPQLRCLLRICRRRGRCCYIREEDRTPWCLCNLDADERAGYRLLLETAMCHCMLQAMPARPPQTELDRAALELERAILPAGDPRHSVLRAFWRGQRAGGRNADGGSAGGGMPAAVGDDAGGSCDV